jgi:hypothetical protein
MGYWLAHCRGRMAREALSEGLMDMDLLNAAKELAQSGFPIFPLCPRSKLPAIREFSKHATTDFSRLEAWWQKNPNYNVGISTDRFVAIDIDNKGEKRGSDELLKLELDGKTFPDTFEQRTPTGGIHLLYSAPAPVKQGANVLGPGLDVRGRGGYVVGAGSVLEAGVYTAVKRPIRPAPSWLISALGVAKARSSEPRVAAGVDPARAAERARRYLLEEAPLALEGQAGDHTTFKVAAKVKDLGADSFSCLELMLEHWNPRCFPPWDPVELGQKIENAYRYGHEPVGASAPETQFEPVKPEKPKKHPFDVLNEEYAYIIGNGDDFVLHETTDAKERFHLKHLKIDSFHRSLASRTMVVGGKRHAISKLWMNSADRRTYNGICFMPGKEAPKGFYNLWRGFTVEPLGETEKPTPRAQASLDAFLEHAFENVCQADQTLYRYLIAWFAHLVQRPWEKPLVAVVMKGRKGVGKNALIERVGYLLGNSSAVVSNKRHLLGNFNSLLENKLMLTLDEAFWSGDKAAEGVLKDLITGDQHLIERKGKEPYRIDNCLRVAILGNEDWLVPASEDERRFAVFNVGEKRRRDNDFFQNMREGMEQGGYRLLLRYLLSYDVSDIKITVAPDSQGLLDQKHRSLPPFQRWWKDCLTEGKVLGADFGGEWPTAVSKDRFRLAFQRYLRERNMNWSSANYSVEAISHELLRVLPSHERGRRREDGERVQVYLLPSLAVARMDWEAFIGGSVEWDPIDEEEEIFS